jgi:hypothetical protein
MTRRQGERPRSRASFTRTLETIAARIAEQRVFDYEESPIGNLRGYETVEIKALWVAGSYARGAAECGDLDLIIEVAITPSRLAKNDDPRRPSLRRLLLKGAKDVQLHKGTPEKNNMGVTFPEARLIWSPAAPDWAGAIAAIRIDSSATRHARRADFAPLRPSQLAYTNQPDLEVVVDLRERGEIEWTWVPLDQIEVKPDEWSFNAWEFAERLTRFRVGRKTQAVMQFVIAYLEATQRRLRWDFRDRSSSPTRFKAGKLMVEAGRPQLAISELNDRAVKAVVLAPHISRRGPNGLWILSRGPKFSRETPEAIDRARELAFRATAGQSAPNT